MNDQTTKKPEKKTDRYRDTVFLPRTDFPMKAGLPEREPQLLKRWADMGLFKLMREQSKGREKFILHDGPPYANGNIHIGHALNKILKDMVTRSAQMAGYDSHYVPGWDCHGLPIEWKIEEQYRAKGKNKDAVPVNEFRQECREFAQHWINVQREEFKRLGVEGNWDNPYTTMNFKSEAVIARELMKFAETGQLYRGSKPVMWSVVEKTALAEAEIEYHDYVSDAIYVKFPVISTASKHGNVLRQSPKNLEAEGLKNAFVLIWTTTPWTIPGNKAISYSKNIQYGLYVVDEAPDGNWAKPGDRYVFADALSRQLQANLKVTSLRRIKDIDPKDIWCEHPLKSIGYPPLTPMLNGDHVTDDAGTGFVHTAPSHGADDYNVWIANKLFLEKYKSLYDNLDANGNPVEEVSETEPQVIARLERSIPTPVDADGFYTKEAPGFIGKRVITDKGEKGDANEAVIAELKKAGMLVARERLRHQYPHSWRSKKPIIFRNTPQWFISMGDGQKNGLREKALAAIEQTQFFPASGQNRLRGMIEQRPDWVISRQRAWGVPIAVFVNKQTGEILNDSGVNQKIYDSFCEEGADAWFADGAAQRYLGDRAADYEQVRDILDVWFDSGCTHAFTLEDRPELKWPADIYLEGSDQHRGWFHSSLLESCGTRGRAPYNQVLTHGFIMGEDGRKMSKSLGNVVAPQDVIRNSGADILRLWVASSDYSDDIGIGPEIIKSNTEAYRKLRNTFRYMLGALDGLKDWEQLANIKQGEMPELERYILHKLWELDQLVTAAYRVYDYKKIFAALTQFMNADLSAFYFDIRKDALYCDPWSSAKRRSCRAVIDQLFQCLVTWWAPILVFTMEEVWLQRFAGEGSSVHLMAFAKAMDDWRDDALAAKWERIREVRSVVTAALEIERANKTIGSSLEAAPKVQVARGSDEAKALQGCDFAEICITSGMELKEMDGSGISVTFAKAEGAKCARSWKISKDIGKDRDFPDITPRDADAVREWQTRSGKTV